jgi:carbonic anhydrase
LNKKGWIIFAGSAVSRLAMPPLRRFAILTCMDARLDPAKFAGLKEGGRSRHL